MHEPVAVAFWWLRLFLAYLTPLPGVLFGRVDVSTVVTSIVTRIVFYYSLMYDVTKAYFERTVKECVYLFSHGLNPYDGSVCHQVILQFLW